MVTAGFVKFYKFSKVRYLLLADIYLKFQQSNLQILNSAQMANFSYSEKSRKSHFKAYLM